jgi:hypothetical protein
MIVSINKQLTIFQDCFGAVSRLSQGKVWKMLSQQITQNYASGNGLPASHGSQTVELLPVAVLYLSTNAQWV